MTLPENQTMGKIWPGEGILDTTPLDLYDYAGRAYLPWQVVRRAAKSSELDTPAIDELHPWNLQKHVEGRKWKATRWPDHPGSGR